MNNYRFMKKLVSTLLVLVMVLTGSSDAFAMQSDKMKDSRGKSVDLVITNIPENQTLTVSSAYVFNAEIAEVNRGFGRVDKGIIRWEIAVDIAGVTGAAEYGVVYPTQAGSFNIRALYFQNDKKYLSWLSNKERNAKSILGSSEWYTITVLDNTFSVPVITLNGNPVVFRDINESYIDQGATAYDSIDGDITDKIKAYGADITGNWPNENYVYYEVLNSLGYYAFTSRMVVSADLSQSQAPVIKLNYMATEIPIGSTYEEFGVVAWDYEDGDISERLVVGGDVVDVNTPGRYDVTFNVTDSNGNAAVQKTVSIIIQEDMNNPKDYFTPEIELYGSQIYYMNPGDTFVEEGYYAWDNYDGVITDKVAISSNLDANVPGTYQITYDVSDMAGNTTQAVRTVIVKDNAPVITLYGGSDIYMTVGEPFVEPGYSATDDRDGDITDLVTVEGSVDTNIIGFYQLTYRVADNAGNETVKYRNIYVNPEVSYDRAYLNGEKVIFLTKGQEFIDPGVTVVNSAGEDVTSQVIIEGMVNTEIPGIYEIYYNNEHLFNGYCYDLRRTVVVSEEGVEVAPVIINYAEGMTILAGTGSNVRLNDYYAFDDKEGNITDRVIVGGDTVDFNTVGTYVVTYNVSDLEGNAAEQKTFTVNVVESY